MLIRSGKNWAIDLFARRGWLVKRRRLRRRAGAWNRPAVVAAECQRLEERILLSTITVTSLADTENAGGGVTLRDAINAANLDLSFDGSVAGQAGVTNVIVFQPGLNGTIALTNPSLGISSSMNIQGLGAANTIIDAHQNSRIFFITNTAGDVTLDGLTLENGRATGDGFQNGGGAIYSFSTGTLTVTNSMLSANSTTGSGAFGGAIFSRNALATLTVTDSTLSGNFTQGSHGIGGAIYSFGAVTISNSSVSGNSTQGLGAIGGAIWTRDGLTVTNSTLSGNSTAGTGSIGGAIFCDGPMTVTNSTITGNLTSGTNASGGAIYLSRSDALSTITNSTIVQNHATNSVGGGIFEVRGGNTLSLRNTILAQNTDNGTAADLSPGIGNTVAILHSLIGDNTGTALTAAQVGSPDANGNLIGTHANPIDPKLGPLANNGGFTQTMAELTGSPAIDAGSNALATDPANGNAALVDDQRGNPFNRIFGTAVDLGAFEFQTLAPVSTPLTGEYAVSTNGSSTLTLASIVTIGAQLLLIGSTVAVATVTSTTQLQVGGTTALYGDSQITFGSTGPFASQVWTKLDLPANYTTAHGAATHVNTNGNSITFIDENGVPSAAVWIGPTQLTAFGQIVTVGGGKLTWSSGTVWYENVSLNGSLNGAGTVNISASPNQFAATDYVYLGRTAYLVQNGTNSVMFVNEQGSFALGSWINSIQALVPAWGNDVATFINGTVFWSDAAVWNPTAAAAPQLTISEYAIGGRTARSIQNGTNTFGFINEFGAIVLGTLTSPTQALVAAWNNDVATFNPGRINWSDHSVWTDATSAPPPLMFTDFTIAGSTAHLIQNGTNTLVFVNEHGAVVLGNWINQTQAIVAAWGNDVATFSAGRVNWSDRSVWTFTTNAAPQLTVTDYVNGSNGLAAHLIENGTNTGIFVNELGTIVLGSLTSPTRALVPAWGNDVATIGNTTINWSDGSVWTMTPPPDVPPLLVTATDANGAVSRVQLLSATTLIGLDGSFKGVYGTRLNGKIFWSNGQVWTNFDLNALNAFFEMGTVYP